MRGAITRDEKPNVRRKYLSPDEARRVIEAAGTIGRQPERDKLLLTMLFRHGLRLSEAIDLRWSDFDRMLKRAHEQSNGNYVFRSERGGPLSAQIAQVIVARAGAVAGLPFKVHPHQLRHVCGFALAEEGTDTRLIQDYLGHRSIANTVVYTETSARQLASVRVR
jgi:type 1 fimbriae regulatory protein FimB